MNLKEVKQLIDYVNKSELTEFKWQFENETLTLKKEKELIASAPMAMAPAAPIAAANALASPTVTESAPAEPVADSHKSITSPMVGTFYLSPSPNSDAFVKVGDSISTGQTLCIVEAMKLMNEIESETTGQIVEICIEDGTPVEFGTVLFKVQ